MDMNDYNVPMPDLYRIIKQSGFDGVILGWSNFIPVGFDKRDHPEIARNAGLQVENIHAPFTFKHVENLWTDRIDGDDYLDSLLLSLNDCAQYDISTMVIHISNSYDTPPASILGLNRLSKLIDKAEQRNINIAIENTFLTGHIDYVFNAIKSDKLGFCFDSGHQNCFTPEDDLILSYGNRLMALHLSDNNGAITTSFERGSFEWSKLVDQHSLPFDGKIDWHKTIAQLRRLQYKSISLEVRNIGYEHLSSQPEEFYSLAYERGKKLYDMLF